MTEATFSSPPPRGELKWIAVDFDGTIAESTWSIDNPTAVPGPVKPFARRKLEGIDRAGYKIIVHTSRPWSDYELVEAYMRHHGLPFSRIVCGKLLAAVYVDDRARHDSEEDWTPYATPQRSTQPGTPADYEPQAESAGRKPCWCGGLVCPG